MAYDEHLAARVRDAVAERAACTEQKMFGGIAFMVNTHMAVAVGPDDLMVHVGVEGHEAALADGAHEVRMGERVMRGWAGVPASAGDDALRAWVRRGVDLALATAPKGPER